MKKNVEKLDIFRCQKEEKKVKYKTKLHSFFESIPLLVEIHPLPSAGYAA